MKHLKRFNESQEKVSIFNPEWTKLIPNKLSIVTDNGEFELEREDEITDGENHPVNVTNLMNCLQIAYYQNTVEKQGGDVTKDGEPDFLEIDITLVKDNDGTDFNPDSLRLNVDISYGDNMQYSFTIDKPNKVSVYHYTGKDSIYDPETFWGFTDKSLKELVDFFNRFGYETTVDDFKFIDDDPDSFNYEHPIEKGDKIEPMIMDDDMKSKVDNLRGGDKIKKYNEFNKNEMIKIPIKVGDTVLGGRFKNKKVVVKKIGKNAKGDITINDKPLLKFRIIKESFKEDVEINLAHLIDEGFVINIDDHWTKDGDSSWSSSFIRIWLPIYKTDTEYSYENSSAFNWSKVEDEVIRAIGYISEHHEIEYLYTIAAKGQDAYGFKRTEWSIDQLIDGNMNPGVIKCFLMSVKHK